MEFNQQMLSSADSESRIAMDSCRICMVHRLETSMDFEDIFDSSISDKLQFCTGLEVLNDDGLPTLICMACLEGLDSAHTFKTVCLESNNAYREIKLLISREAIDHDHDYNTVVSLQDGFEGLSFTLLEDCGLSDQDEMLEAVLNQCDAGEQISLEQTSPEGENTLDLSPAKDVDVEVKRATVRKKRGKYKKRPKGDFERAKRRKWFCEVCQIQFSSKKLTDEHNDLMHKEAHCCAHCGRLFTYISTYLDHMRRHVEPAHRCDQCEYATWSNSDLQKHLKMHSGVKEFQCESCSATYSVVSNLRAHINRVHKKAKPHECSVCSARFFERTKLELHMLIHKQMRRVIYCEECDRYFLRGLLWRKHMAKKHGVDIPRLKAGRKKTVYSTGLGVAEGAAYTYPYTYVNIMLLEESNHVGRPRQRRKPEEVQLSDP